MQAISRANLALHLSPANSYCRLCRHKGPGEKETPDPSSSCKAQRSRRRTPSTMEQRHGKQSALAKRSTTTPELYTSKNAIERLTTSRGVGFKRTSTLGQAASSRRPAQSPSPSTEQLTSMLRTALPPSKRCSKLVAMLLSDPGARQCLGPTLFH